MEREVRPTFSELGGNMTGRIFFLPLSSIVVSIRTFGEPGRIVLVPACIMLYN